VDSALRIISRNFFMKSGGEITLNKGRDLRLDSLRGLMLVTMTVNHLPSSLRLFTDESLGIFSSAEGFVFISGLLAGIVYTRRLRRDGPGGLRQAATHRAGMIWGWQIGAVLTALLAVQVTSWLSGFCSWSNPPLFYAHPWLAALLGSAMLYQPGLLDILPMYCVFVLLLPYALTALEEGRYGRVLGWSAAAWFAVQWIPPIDGGPLYPVHVGSFNIFAWQFLFVLGAAIGHSRVTASAPQVRFRPVLLAAAVGLVVYSWCVRHLQWRPPGCPDWLFGILLNKPNMGVLRLADFLAAAYLVASVSLRFPSFVTWRPLAFLGQHSLAVVAAQSVAVLVLLNFTVLFATPLRDYLATTATIALLFVAAAVHREFLRRRKAAAELRPRQAPVLPLSRPHDVHAA
jgi:hypothetical protein